MDVSSDRGGGRPRDGSAARVVATTDDRTAVLVSNPGSYAHIRTAVPRSPRDLVVRRRLLELLDRGLDAKLILVCAPAGSGKTTLVSSWAAGHGRVAWLSLEGADDDLDTFVRLLVTASQVQAPDVGETTHLLLTTVRAPDPTCLARQVAADLLALPDDLVVVLDDFQVVESPDVLAFVAAFIALVPARVHVVVVTRTEPLLPIARWRAHGDLVEIRTEALQFTRDEQQAFLQAALGATPSDDLVDAVGEHTEGWAVGLRLATLGMRPRVGDTAGAPRQSASQAAFWRDFLVQDVLAAQSPDTQRLLLRAAIPERVCAPLLRALGADDPAESVPPDPLEALVRANLFLTALDDDGVWYRFHPLFREALLWAGRTEWSDSELAAIHRRAGAWLASEQLIDDAIQHSLWGGDQERAATLVEAGVRQRLNRELGLEPVERWLRLLGSELVNARPGLLLARAWILLHAGRRDEIPPLVQAAEELLPLTDPADSADEIVAMRGQIILLKGSRMLVRGGPTGDRDAVLQHMLSAADQSLALLPAGWDHAWSRAAFRRTVALQMLGRSDEAIAWLVGERAAWTGPEAAGRGFALLALVRLHLVTLDLDAAESAAYDLIRIATEHEMPISLAWGRVVVGLIEYERNDLVAAHARLLSAYPLSPHAPVGLRMEATFGLALTYQALGQAALATHIVRAFAELLADTAGVVMRRLISSMEARLALARGETAIQPGPARPPDSSSPLALLAHSEDAQVTLVRVLLASGTPPALAEAMEIVERVESSAVADYYPLQEVRAMLLRALLLQAHRNTGAALETLSRAIERTRPGGWTRIIVDLGAPMRELLMQLVEQRAERDFYLDRLLAGFPDDSAGAQVHTAKLDASPPPSAQRDLVEPLTWRELEILELLAERLSNKEIATKLVISPLTVKRHSMNIYQKLQASGRRDAVTRATALGLLHSG